MVDEKSAFKRQQSAMKEFDVLHKILHQCICRAYKINTQEPLNDDINEDEEDSEISTISLYLEFLPKSLKECIDKKILGNTMKAQIAVEVAHALNFIHKHNMIHRDVKNENKMLDSNFKAKVVDFGLVQINECFNGQSFVTTTMTRGVGTLYYMSPEMASEEEYNNSTDVYSYGIVLYYLLIGKLPQHSVKDKTNGKLIPMPEPSSSISNFGIKLITKCTDYEPLNRPSFEEILNEMRGQSFEIAPGIDQSLVSKRDHELSLFESTHS